MCRARTVLASPCTPETDLGGAPLATCYATFIAVVTVLLARGHRQGFPALLAVRSIHGVSSGRARAAALGIFPVSQRLPPEQIKLQLSDNLRMVGKIGAQETFKGLGLLCAVKLSNLVYLGLDVSLKVGKPAPFRNKLQVGIRKLRAVLSQRPLGAGIADYAC